ncbi:MAG: GNAT family N-acetyltransferase, partial [Gammaproteobacteria bacterium]
HFVAPRDNTQAIKCLSVCPALSLPDSNDSTRQQMCAIERYEACQAVIRWLSERGVEKFAAEIDTRNVGSIRLIEKLGFRRVAYVPRAALIRGADSDEYHYSLAVPRKS